MKKCISLVSAYLGRVGFYFLLTILLFSLIALVTGSSTVNLVLIWSALLFGGLLGLADEVFKIRFLGSYAVKTVIHSVLAVLAFAISFVFVSGVIETEQSKVWSIFLFAILVLIVAVIRGITHMLLSKKANETKSYDYLYTSKD